MIAGRVVTGLAAVILLAVVLISVWPNPGTTESSSQRQRVNCGTLLVRTTHSLDDGCEDHVVARSVAAVLLWPVAVVLGTVGLVLLHRAGRDL